MNDKIHLKQEQLTVLIKEALKEIVDDHLNEEAGELYGYDWYYSAGILDGSVGKEMNDSVSRGLKGGTAKKAYEEGYAVGLKQWVARQPIKKVQQAPRWEE